MNATYSIHHLRAQDGAAVWVLARAMEDGGRLLACGEYMTQSAAIAAAQQLNAERQAVAA